MATPDRSDRRRILSLEERLRALESEVLLARQSATAHLAPRERWLARVEGTPAASDDTFTCELLSCRFTAAPGTQAVLYHARGSRVVARSFPTRGYAAGDYVVVERLRGQLSGDAETGEWWICAGPAEMRWGRTTAVGASYPDLSLAGGVTRGMPIYEIELGHMGYEWPANQAISVAWQRLDPANGQVDTTLTLFAADAPATIVPAHSLIGDLHRGQPVLCALEGGKWYIIGPSQVQVSRERLSFVDGYLESGGTQQSWVKYGNRLGLRFQSMQGTGGQSGLSLSAWYDVRTLAQSTFDDSFAVINRRGDYLITLQWTPSPYQYGYLTGSYSASEAQSLTGATITSTTAAAHTHDVAVKNQYACYWQANLTLEVCASTLPRVNSIVLRDSAPLYYDQPLGATRQITQLATFNAGDELRLVLDLDDTAYSDAALTHRGVDLGVGYQTLTLMRLGEGGTWSP